MKKHSKYNNCGDEVQVEEIEIGETYFHEINGSYGFIDFWSKIFTLKNKNRLTFHKTSVV